MSETFQPQPPVAPARSDDDTVRIVEEHVIRGHELLFRRPPVRMNVALVMVSPKGTYRVALPNSQPTMGELVWRRVRALYEVDLGDHHSVIEDDPPSTGDAFPFHAVVDLRWRVQDPVNVVKRHLVIAGDIVRAIGPELRSRIRAITREFEVGEAARAEIKVNWTLSSAPVGDDLGLWTQCWVRLTRDEGTREHAPNRRDARYESTAGYPAKSQR